MRRSVLAPKQITRFHLVFAAHQFVGSNAFFANLAVFIQHQLQHVRSLLFARAGIKREVTAVAVEGRSGINGICHAAFFAYALEQA